MLHSIRTLALRSADVAAARDWCARFAGTKAYFDEPFYVGFDLGGYELGIQPAPGAPTALWGVYDLDGALAKVVELGGEVVTPIRDVGDGIRVCAFRDPFGNDVGLIDNPHFRVPSAQATVVVDQPAQLAAPDGVLAPVDIHHSVVVPAPVAEVYADWTNSERMSGWLGIPTVIDLCIGGAYELHFMADAPAGSRGSDHCKVLSFLPGAMVSFTWNAPPHHQHTRLKHTWVVLLFTATEGGTRIDLHHTGWPQMGWTGNGTPLADSPWPDTHTYFDQAWGRMLQGYAISRAQ
jgi:uncharacterized protein YndB with AHSA1/START domain